VFGVPAHCPGGGWGAVYDAGRGLGVQYENWAAAKLGYPQH